MRIFSWVMAGIGLGIALTILMINEYDEAEERLASGPTRRVDEEEEWPVGKSFDPKPRLHSVEKVGAVAGSMNN